MGSRRIALLALFGLVALLPGPAARAQTVPACPRGGGIITPTTLGALVMREGDGLGAVTLGATAADVERAWGQPSECRPQPRGYAYQYFLSDDGGQTGLLIMVGIYEDRVEQILATLLPHSGGRGPAMRTSRGVGILSPAGDVRRTYGAHTLEAQNAVGYLAEGVAFQLSRGVVGAILVFSRGMVPPGWRSS